ncbi:O-antigen ligase family protein (plasmid) [Sphingomonas paucimobilis]|uniref:O-antigen ligase family protein n=1 Tax=Sphingomonas TaxID=13687 RepID=UPI0024349616|nr:MULTISPECIES: O-antigen ligase family protein [Sphingomonas]MDG5973009.1 O-antigen ligase family protein [Sphingomonas paucimobilis]MDR6116804.1 hypothetical protein [Sphingomonas sp. SORGH_AS_0789]MDR6151857.1 hypothetical protein [Sphingomonas sp. SORGH_AS_0742]
MQKSRSTSRRLQIDPIFALMCLMLATLWLAGGASRPDVLGQVVVRSVATLALVMAVLFGPAPAWRQGRPVVLLFAAIVALVALQLIPLPPAIWTSLPGRGLLLDASAITGAPQPWRPLTMVPGATWNALYALLVPGVVLVLALMLDERDRRYLPDALLVMVVAMAPVAVLQFSGTGLDNPLVNETIGQPSGNFANRNHFALFLAMGCMIAPVWAVRSERAMRWKLPIAGALMLLFLLAILASGSRGGLLLAGIALVGALALVRRDLHAVVRRGPRWLYPVLIVLIVTAVTGIIFLSVAADRAVAINRIFAVDAGSDMRVRGLPTVLSMIGTYFPVGSGFGGFDPIFRIHEPMALLRLTYFNHAHDDWLEVLLDGGVGALIVLLMAFGWWLWASVRVWRRSRDEAVLLGRLGSGLLLLMWVASAFDYPSRTPIMMMIIILAALWLHWGSSVQRSALPR